MPTVATSIDFQRSLPPVPPMLDREIRGALTAVKAATDFAQLAYRSISGGTLEQRAAGARLVAPRFGEPPAPERILVVNGTQSAVMVLLQKIVTDGGWMAAERLSYGPLRTLAGLARVPLKGLAIDHDGIIPDAFADACRDNPPKVLYCNPTVQNPTTAVMPEARRLEIADIARRHGVTIIEDEALGRLHPDAPPPFAALAPDITWYVMSTTKCLAQGFRLAYMVAPEQGADILASIAHLSYWHPAPLEATAATHLIESGAADRITAWIAGECAAREALAREILWGAGMGIATKPGSMHVWLSLPAKRDSTAFAAAAKAEGVLLRPASLFATDDNATLNGVRLSLSTPGDRAEVERGLEIVRGLAAA